MKEDEIYDYNSTFPNPNADIPIDILNNVPVYHINNTYDFSWDTIEITELNIIVPY